jgi:hypothetical protein
MAKVNSFNRALKASWPPAGQESLPASGAGFTGWTHPETHRVSLPGERPQRRGTVSPNTTGGQHPTRWGRRVRRGRGGRRPGLWPPAGVGSAWRCGRGDGPCHGSGESAFVSVDGSRKRMRFPRPCGTLSPRPMPPTQRQASAPPSVRVTVINRGSHRTWSNPWFLQVVGGAAPTALGIPVTIVAGWSGP